MTVSSLKENAELSSYSFLHGQLDINQRKPIEETLDRLYLDIVNLFCDTSTKTEGFYRWFKAVVRAIITVFDPPSAVDLAACSIID